MLPDNGASLRASRSDMSVQGKAEQCHRLLPLDLAAATSNGYIDDYGKALCHIGKSREQAVCMAAATL